MIEFSATTFYKTGQQEWYCVWLLLFCPMFTAPRVEDIEVKPETRSTVQLPTPVSTLVYGHFCHLIFSLKLTEYYRVTYYHNQLIGHWKEGCTFTYVYCIQFKHFCFPFMWLKVKELQHYPTVTLFSSVHCIDFHYLVFYWNYLCITSLWHITLFLNNVYYVCQFSKI